MKTIVFGVALALVLTLAFFWTWGRFGTKATAIHMGVVGPEPTAASVTQVPITNMGHVSRIQATGLRKKVKAPDLPPAALARWRELEALGHLPTNANTRDLRLAAMTSWWGQSLDPERFWKGRPIWLDEVSITQAGIFGRSFPPIPLGDHKLPVFNERQKSAEVRLAESMALTIPPAECTSEERCFWGQWRKTHPNPPNAIAEAQYKVGCDLAMFRGRVGSVDWFGQRFETHDYARIRDSAVGDKVEIGLPQEAFSEEALRWALIEGTRRQQLKDEQEGHTRPGVLSGTLDGSLLVDAQYALRDLTPEEQKNADAWKLSYLRRLKAEKTDEMYLQAYLKAWKLDPKAVFGP